MKILYPDRSTSITADEADADYPIFNVENDYVEEKWKATSNTARVTVVLSQGSGCFVYGTNATGIVVTIKEGAWVDSDELSNTATYGISNGKGALWVDYDELSGEHTIWLDFTSAAGTIVEAGIVRAGDVSSFRDPSQGMQEGLSDLSIKKPLGEGAKYFKKQEVIRTFGFTPVSYTHLTLPTKRIV